MGDELRLTFDVGIATREAALVIVGPISGRIGFRGGGGAEECVERGNAHGKEGANGAGLAGLGPWRAR